MEEGIDGEKRGEIGGKRTRREGPNEGRRGDDWKGNRKAPIGVGFKSEVCFWNPMPLNLLERRVLFRFLFVCLVHIFCHVLERSVLVRFLL